MLKWIRKILKGKSEWISKHNSNWDPKLLMDNGGITIFQEDLSHQVKRLLTDIGLEYSIKETEHKDDLEDEKEVKLIEYRLPDLNFSSIWIYHDMAEYEIKNIHHIYERWGYLSPEELYERFLLSLKETLIGVKKRKYVSFENSFIDMKIFYPDIHNILIELDVNGRVSKEVGVNEEGKIIHKYPNTEFEHGTRGIFDQNTFDLHHGNEISEQEFKLVWSGYVRM